MKLIHKPKKSLGQNFLIDKNIINKIIEVGKIDSKKTILEIGAGYGHLTKLILKRNPKKLFVIEKDKRLFDILNNIFGNNYNVNIINDDILKVIKRKKFDKKIIVFGNLPYNISTKILTELITLDKWPPWYDLLILMFQKEVADRIIAKYKTKEFSRLTVLSNWRLDITKHFDISNNCFYPKPKVDSTLLSFKPKINKNFKIQDSKTLEYITRIFFSNRRKMINKNFKKLFNKNKDIIKRLNIDLTLRPEELKNESFYKIAEEFEKLIK